MNFGLDDNGDLALSQNNLTMISGKPEIMQIIKLNLQSVAGEWFLDETLGLPWFDQILEVQNSDTNLDTIFLDSIRTSDGVLSVLRFETELDRGLRVLRIAFAVVTADGILEFDDSITPGGL